MAERDAFLAAAVETLAERVFAADSDVHTVYEGERHVGGRPTGERAVVALVDHKRPAGEIAAQGLRTVPQSVIVGNGQSVPVDVQEGARPFDGAPFQIQLLFVDPAKFTLQAATDHQRCFSPVVPGGAQIAPAGANWVGTLGIPWIFPINGRERIGFLTNRHVAGVRNRVGHACCQPHPGTSPIGTLAAFETLTANGINEFDLAFFDAHLNGAHYVSRGQMFGLGRIAAAVADFDVGDVAAKSGRTTGVTRFRCVGKNAVTTINYEPGLNLRFAGLDLFAKDNGGDPSAPGDSGSAILTDGGEFGSLLFAGGGGRTLGIPARKIADKTGGRPFV